MSHTAAKHRRNSIGRKILFFHINLKKKNPEYKRQMIVPHLSWNARARSNHSKTTGKYY